MGLRGIQRAALNQLKADTHQGTEFFDPPRQVLHISGNPEHDNKGPFCIIGHREGTERMVPMRTGQKRRKQSDWQFTMEQIRRELGKIYRQPKRLPGPRSSFN